jgi:glyoxylase-like metal-dependent hydrolase (beta-lactamase superfamily II)
MERRKKEIEHGRETAGVQNFRHQICNSRRPARRPFIGGDPHDGPMPMDYFTWVVVGPDRVFSSILDSLQKRQRAVNAPFCAVRSRSLRQLDIDPDAVTDVILTHLHYDHVGNFHKLPHARSSAGA